MKTHYESEFKKKLVRNGVKKVIPLKYNPISGRMYLSVGEFKKKVQPYLVDICMQNFKY